MAFHARPLQKTMLSEKQSKMCGGLDLVRPVCINISLSKVETTTVYGTDTNK